MVGDATREARIHFRGRGRTSWRVFLPRKAVVLQDVQVHVPCVGVRLWHHPSYTYQRPCDGAGQVRPHVPLRPIPRHPKMGDARRPCKRRVRVYDEHRRKKDRAGVQHGRWRLQRRLQRRFQQPEYQSIKTKLEFLIPYYLSSSNKKE